MEIVVLNCLQLKNQPVWARATSIFNLIRLFTMFKVFTYFYEKGLGDFLNFGIYSSQLLQEISLIKYCTFRAWDLGPTLDPVPKRQDPFPID